MTWDPDPLRPPDPDPLPVAGHQGCARWWLLWLAVGAAFWAIVVALVLANRAAPRPSPQPSPVETTAGAPSGARQAGAGIETRPWPRPGSIQCKPDVGLCGDRIARPDHDRSRGQLVPELPSEPAGAPPLRGFATWCGPTPTQCQSWGGDAMLGAVPSFRFGDEPYRVTVSREGRQPVMVLVVSFCACRDRHGEPTLIDLSPRAFAQLAPLSRGVVRVELAPVSWKGME